MNPQTDEPPPHVDRLFGLPATFSKYACSGIRQGRRRKKGTATSSFPASVPFCYIP